MGPRRSRLGVLLGAVIFVCGGLAAADNLSELQSRFDRESDSVRKAKLLEKLGDAQFAVAREAEKANDYGTVGLTLEKYRDNVRAAVAALKRQHPDAERHYGGYRQVQFHVRKALRELQETLLVAPPEYKPPLRLVRDDLAAINDELLRMLFPRRSGEQRKAASPAEKRS
jgi:hypothetical protein